MTVRPDHFGHHRQAALALLSECPHLSHKAAGFLGHVCIASVLSTSQRNWLVKLLDRHGLPPLAPWLARDVASQRLGEVQ